MNITTLINAAAGLNGVQYITPGETVNAPSGRIIMSLIPMGGDATLSGIIATSPNAGVPSDIVLTQDVAYPLACSSVTLDAGSVGNLLVIFA
jgi:hypothetical protein